MQREGEDREDEECRMILGAEGSNGIGLYWMIGSEEEGVDGDTWRAEAGDVERLAEIDLESKDTD